MQTYAIADPLTPRLIAMEAPPAPLPGPKEVRVAMTASSINPIDRLIATGYGAALLNPHRRYPRILGRDGVGVITEVGSAVQGLRVGQRVALALSPRRDGTYAEQVTVPAACACVVSEGISNDVAATIGYAGSTAAQALRTAELQPATARGRRLLIHGASGGLGTIAVQMAARWGARVTAVCSAPNHAWLRQLGASETMDYEEALSLQTLPADSVIDFATPASEDRDRHRAPLLAALQRTPGRRFYATTITPTLGLVTRHGLASGLLRAGVGYAVRRADASRHGLRLRQVLFSESPGALSLVVDFFSKPGAQSVVRRELDADKLPMQFTDAAQTRIPGKTLIRLPST